MKTISVFGDVMLDHYYSGEVSRVSPEAPVPVVRKVNEYYRLGGAANVAANLANLNLSVNLFGSVGIDKQGEILQKMLSEKYIGNNLINISIQTTCKTRIVGNGQQIVRLDQEELLSETQVDEKFDNKRINFTNLKLIVLSDYNKGFCTSKLCQLIINSANKFNIPILIDPKGKNWKKYMGATIVTPNVNELSQIADRVITNTDPEVSEIGLDILKKFKFKYLIVTRGDKGISLITEDSKVYHEKGFPIQVFDVTGAGDTVISGIAKAIIDGFSIEDSVKIANYLGHLAVSKKGVYIINESEYKASIKNLINDKEKTKSLLQ